MRRSTKIDECVGINIRKLRLSRGLTQAALAEKSNTSFQQLQKYEKGENRVSAGRLWQLKHILEVDFDDFFEGATIGGSTPIPKDTVKLNRAFAKISDPTLRQSALSLVQKFATL